MGRLKINGKIYETFKDNEGIERFKPNNLILKMKITFGIKVSELVKLMELESITLMDLLDYYTGIGFIVCGVEELSFFDGYEFERIYINCDCEETNNYTKHESKEGLIFYKCNDCEGFL